MTKLERKNIIATMTRIGYSKRALSKLTSLVFSTAFFRKDTERRHL